MIIVTRLKQKEMKTNDDSKTVETALNGQKRVLKRINCE